MDLLSRIASSPETMKEFQRERLATEITELICRLMDEQGVSRTELANRLGVSRAYVTKMLRYGTNLTVHTIADVFTALNRTLRAVDRPLAVSSPSLSVMEIPYQLTGHTTISLDWPGIVTGHANVTGTLTNKESGHSSFAPPFELNLTPGTSQTASYPRIHEREEAA